MRLPYASEPAWTSLWLFLSRRRKAAITIWKNTAPTTSSRTSRGLAVREGTKLWWKSQGQGAPAEGPALAGRQRSLPRVEREDAEQAVGGEVSGLADEKVKRGKLACGDTRIYRMDDRPQNASRMLGGKRVGRKGSLQAEPQDRGQPPQQLASRRETDASLDGG